MRMHEPEKRGVNSREKHTVKMEVVITFFLHHVMVERNQKFARDSSHKFCRVPEKAGMRCNYARKSGGTGILVEGSDVEFWHMV